MIPKVIHKVLIVDGMNWPKHIPKGMQDAIDSFTIKNPGYTVKLYSGNDCIDYIKKHYNNRVLKCFMKVKPYSYKCDLFRHLVLYQEGGWYSDIRQICMQPLDELNRMNKEFHVAKDCYINPRYLYTAFIGSIHKHPISKKTYEKILWNIEHDHYGIDTLCPTGPGAFIEGGIDYIRSYPNKCNIGQHLLNGDQQGFVCFKKTVYIKNKYNDSKGADTSDLPGGNDYGDMWRAGNVYVT